jgi:hypothetical protein
VWLKSGNGPGTNVCSVVVPFQVFILLETVYNNFDLIAKKLGVFKVSLVPHVEESLRSHLASHRARVIG